ncbi:MAG: 16S rRNA (uracil(1498)-N(3))-methyltransferase [Butyrivibrio sp.]|nr:16S rRNA (uracil(1498)-N(3))-methyltransferase [Butyrivibrio sp.]
MNRFFAKTENISEDGIILDGSDVNHIKNVLRMKVGEKLMVAGGNNSNYICAIREFAEDEVMLTILETCDNDNELKAEVYLFQGLPKSDKMELIIQKCVELGVHEIIPVNMKRCVVKLDDKKTDAKIKRWNSISESAAKQSGRGIIPRVSAPVSFDEAIKLCEEMDVKLIPYELAEGMQATTEALSKIAPGMKIGFFIGPEGGFELSEIKKAKENGIIPISLGKRILRTETAGLTVMSILMYHLETI